MNRDREIMKSIRNKQEQAREHYEKNRPLLAESKLQEKGGFVKNQEVNKENQKEEKDI